MKLLNQLKKQPYKKSFGPGSCAIHALQTALGIDKNVIHDTLLCLDRQQNCYDSGFSLTRKVNIWEKGVLSRTMDIILKQAGELYEFFTQEEGRKISDIKFEKNKTYIVKWQNHVAAIKNRVWWDANKNFERFKKESVLDVHELYSA